MTDIIPSIATGDPPTDTTEEGTWQSLCLTTDKAAAVYFTTFTLILIVVGFCFYQLIHKPDCSDQQAYLSVLTMILGVVLPSPVMAQQRQRT